LHKRLKEENGRGYYITRNPETDFEPGEIRAIIDTFSYGSYIAPLLGKDVIKKCKNLQNIYENEKLRNYKIYANDNKTDNMEVVKNIEDISDAICNLNKVTFEYWKYEIRNKLEKTIVSTPKVAPYAIVYNKQEFYLIGIKEGLDKFYYFRLDRIKNLKQLEEKRTVKKTESQIKEFAESTVEMFGGEKEEIEAICSRELINAVFDHFGKNITIEKINNDDQNFRLILDVNTLGFKMWAMRNIDLVEVIRPLSLRVEMKEIVEKAYKKYNT